MLTKSTIALSVALALGAGSAALAKQPAANAEGGAWQMSAHAVYARAEMARWARPFTPAEKTLFDRASRLF